MAVIRMVSGFKAKSLFGYDDTYLSSGGFIHSRSEVSVPHLLSKIVSTD